MWKLCTERMQQYYIINNFSSFFSNQSLQIIFFRNDFLIYCQDLHVRVNFFALLHNCSMLNVIFQNEIGSLTSISGNFHTQHARALRQSKTSQLMNNGLLHTVSIFFVWFWRLPNIFFLKFEVILSNFIVEFIWILILFGVDNIIAIRLEKVNYNFLLPS